jgi:hypothetical protein
VTDVHARISHAHSSSTAAASLSPPRSGAQAVRHETEKLSALHKEVHAIKRKLKKKRGIAVSAPVPALSPAL